MHWTTQIAVAEQELSNAEAALVSCEATGYYDDDDDYHEPDCTAEAIGVATARDHLALCEERLRKVEKWEGICEAAIGKFQRASSNFGSVVLDRLPQMRNFLSVKRDQYVAAINAGSGLIGSISIVAPVSSTNELTSDWGGIRGSEDAGGGSEVNQKRGAKSDAEAPPLTAETDSTGLGSVDPGETGPFSAELTARALMREMFAAAGIREGQQVTAENVEALRVALCRSDAPAIGDVLKGITTSSNVLTSAFIGDVVKEFTSIVPQKLASQLPQLAISVESGMKAYGVYKGAGILCVADDLDVDQARQTLFHELGHWVHRDAPEWYRASIRSHFNERTRGEEIAPLFGFGDSVGKQDNWSSVYTGRVYPLEMKNPTGSEIPSTHFEKLALPDAEVAKYLSDSDFRETMEISLSVLV
jgi:hypothetical protein